MTRLPGGLNRDPREVLLFFAGTFVQITALAVIARNAGGLEHAPATVPLAMLTPMLSAAAVQKFVARQPVFGRDGLGLRWSGLHWLLLAPALIAMLLVISFAVTFGVSPETMATYPQFVGQLGHLANVPKGLGVGASLAAAVAITVLVAPVLNLPIFLGEEIGWRGFMNPRLIRMFGRRGLLAGGAIWAVWHLPIILLGHNYPDHPLLGMAVWIPVCACLNVLLDAVRRASGSILPCALAHGMLNQLGMLLLLLAVRKDRFIDVLHGPVGLIGLAVLLPAAIWAYHRATILDEHRDAGGMALPAASAA